ncbi:hypothetical protein [Rhodococcus sp. IEGM 1379]|uniref:variant leucine-rich repeat-containing protein n=1 Tax=Rhodococcus sp. IEGM 1379 TaxID=3047086 RepID=UPI0024B71A13|nr:hypothetical protein [Rhodococcus sp. IEGM 1379]MDI9914319.1 hypothetical protein [Rhodococcus sp. IEGM 1379]
MRNLARVLTNPDIRSTDWSIHIVEIIKRHITAPVPGAIGFCVLLVAAIISWTASAATWPGFLILLCALLYGLSLATGGPLLENLPATFARMVPIVGAVRSDLANPAIASTDPDAVAASDPRTDQTALMQLAWAHPHLRPLVARNPAAYPALLDWLAALGDPAVNEALRQRPQQQQF